ncbi:MAG TPA: hypothetical protein VFC78_01630, partial [Tepidisphaeraceae bacterium]|nr:hypothetical protein [Tepidisphaeraceae bacterium]
EPALPLQTQCLETTPLPPILQRAFRGFHAYLMPISKIKLHCATISKHNARAKIKFLAELADSSHGDRRRPMVMPCPKSARFPTPSPKA